MSHMLNPPTAMVWLSLTTSASAAVAEGYTLFIDASRYEAWNSKGTPAAMLHAAAVRLLSVS
jgi:hypothetical protein